MPKQYSIPCRVTLDGATMVVEADSTREANEKAEKNDYVDIIYDTAAMVDWEVTGIAKLDE